MFRGRLIFRNVLSCNDFKEFLFSTDVENLWK